MPLDATNGRNIVKDVAWIDFKKIETSLDEGTYATDYKVGDKFKMWINGTLTNGIIIGIDVDVDENGNQVPLTIMPEKIFKTDIFSHNTAFGGPYDENAKSKSNSFGNWLNSFLKKRVCPVVKYTCNVNVSSNATVNNTRSIETYWPLSLREVDREPSSSAYSNGIRKETQGAVYSSYFNTSAKRQMMYNTTTVEWFLRSCSKYYGAGGYRYGCIAIITAAGESSNPGSWGANRATYTQICFCLK